MKIENKLEIKGCPAVHSVGNDTKALSVRLCLQTSFYLAPGKLFLYSYTRPMPLVLCQKQIIKYEIRGQLEITKIG